jgi:hypothetical protein
MNSILTKYLLTQNPKHYDEQRGIYRETGAYPT